MTDGIDLTKIPSPDVFVTLRKDEQEAILELDSIRSFKKGDFLVKEGQFYKESYFVVTGVVREFRIIDGEEKTSSFYMEDETIHSSASSTNRIKATSTLECLEDCKISVVNFDKQSEMLARFPRFEKMCRISTEKHLQEFQEKVAIYMASSPEERYKRILNKRPELLDRVPQYHLASYLGIKPESLSRIRKRLAGQ